MKKITLIIMSLLISSCDASTLQDGLQQLESSEKAFEKRVQKEALDHMSRDIMFPDEDVRRVAKAVSDNDVNYIKKLIGEGVDVNSKGKSGATLLFYALRSNKLKSFKALLTLGADPNVVFPSEEEVKRTIIEKNIRMHNTSIIHYAIRYNKDIRFLEEALKHGGNPNLKARNPSSPPLFDTLTSISYKKLYKKNIKARELLIKYGADIHALTGEIDFGGSLGTGGGDSLVLQAAGMGYYQDVYYFLLLGVDPNHRNIIGLGLDNKIRMDKAHPFIKGSQQESDFERVINWLEAKGFDFNWSADPFLKHQK